MSRHRKGSKQHNTAKQSQNTATYYSSHDHHFSIKIAEWKKPYIHLYASFIISYSFHEVLWPICGKQRARPATVGRALCLPQIGHRTLFFLLSSVRGWDHHITQQETCYTSNDGRACPERCTPDDTTIKNDGSHNCQVNEVQNIQHHWHQESEQAHTGWLIQRWLQKPVHTISGESSQKGSRQGDHDRAGVKD